MNKELVMKCLTEVNNYITGSTVLPNRTIDIIKQNLITASLEIMPTITNFEVIKELISVEPSYTMQDWTDRFYLMYGSTRKELEEIATNNNGIIPLETLNSLYWRNAGVTPRHIQITFDGKYKCA